MVHDAGDEPSLPACKEFFCFTARVFTTLVSIGVIEEERIRGRTMEELNRIAVEALLILASLVTCDRRARDLKEQAKKEIQELLNSHSRWRL